MSAQQSNAWQTAGRSRHNHSASRTPQNRSSTASPAQSTPPTQPPKSETPRPTAQQQQAPAPTTNVWSQRSSTNSTNAAQTPPTSSSPAPISATEDLYTPVNGFNAADVRAFLAREPAPPAYRPAEASGAARGSGGAWGAKANTMANGQPFFVQLAKQVAAFEGGG